jgi:hypothetical protein
VGKKEKREDKKEEMGETKKGGNMKVISNKMVKFWENTSQ